MLEAAVDRLGGAVAGRRASADRHPSVPFVQFLRRRQRIEVTEEEVGKRVVHEKRRVIQKCQSQLPAEQLLVPVPSQPAARIDGALRHLSRGLRGSGLHGQVSEFLDVVLVERPHGGLIRDPAEEALQDVEDRDGSCVHPLLGFARHTWSISARRLIAAAGVPRSCSRTLHTLLFSIPPSPMQARVVSGAAAACGPASVGTQQPYRKTNIYRERCRSEKVHR